MTPLEISWTKRALKLDPEAREHLEAMLRRLHVYFPEIKTDMRIGITRAYDGLAFQSDSGYVKIMLEVRRTRKGPYKYPTYWTIGHELMHLAQFNSEGIPSGERACDTYALSRLPPRFIDEAPSYLVISKIIRKNWSLWHARIAHELAKAALEKRADGYRTYASWWEDEFEAKAWGRGPL